jgi:1,4-dihydroxy-2-naphthoyl-CoA hydrolase
MALTNAGPLAERLGIELVEAAPERVVGTMPVAGNTQPYGLLHGGATLALAESLGSAGAHLHAGTGRQAVGIEISASHHRSTASGTVTGVATAAHLGHQLATYDVLVSDEAGRRLCSARITCFLRDAPPG